MVAITEPVQTCMRTNLTKLHNRMLCLIPFELTHDECLELVAPSEHHNILKTAAEYAEINSTNEWMGLHIPATIDGTDKPKIALLMRTHQSIEPPLRPRSPAWQMEASKAGYVMGWATKRLEYGRRAALVDWVLSQLSKKCESGSQIRYIWPAVMHLCRRLGPYENSYSEKLQIWVEKNSAYKVPRYVPALDKPLRDAIQETSGWLTAAALLGDDLEEPAPAFVSVTLYGASYFGYHGNYLTRK